MIRNAATFFLDNSPGIRKWEVEMDGRKGLRWNYEEKIPLPPLPPPPLVDLVRGHPARIRGKRSFLS